MSSTIINEYLSPIASLLSHPNVGDIAINNDQSVWFCEKNEWIMFDKKLSPRAIHAISSLLTVQKQHIHQYISCFEFGDLRITIARPPVSNNNEIMIIRKQRANCLSLNDFISSSPTSNTKDNYPSEYCSYGLADLKSMVSGRKNIIISGETGSGKTSLLQSLTKFFQPNERIVFIQDVAEITNKTPNSIFLMTTDKIALSHLVSFSLRCCPDRIIVGEIRGSEIYAFLESCNTGHRGNITTVHANSATDTLYRLETLLYQANETNHWSSSMIRKMIHSNIDYVIHMKRGSPFPVINEILRVEGKK